MLPCFALADFFVVKSVSLDAWFGWVTKDMLLKWLVWPLGYRYELFELLVAQNSAKTNGRRKESHALQRCNAPYLVHRSLFSIEKKSWLVVAHVHIDQ